MKRDLAELDAEKSKEFLDYFNAALRAKNRIPFSPTGSGRFTEFGYEACLDDMLATNDGGGVAVSWKILLNPDDGSAISVEAFTDADIEEEQWGQQAEKFIGDIIVSVLSGRKETFFQRRYYSAISGSNLPGEYWLPGYRFAPQFPEDESHLIHAERYLVIDQEVDAIDSWHAMELANERAAIASAHLSLITNVGLCEPKHEMKWIMKNEAGVIKQYRESTQHIDMNRPKELSKKGEVCTQVQFAGSVFEHEHVANNEFRCPTETRSILRGLRKTNPAKKAAFDKCALLYQLALTIGLHHPTVRISYEYASIDALVRELGKEYAGFSDFVRKNTAGVDDRLLDYIHSRIRSAHWHSGEFALGETDHRQDFLTNPAEHVRFDILRESHRLIRTAIFNWVMREIADNNTQLDSGQIEPEISGSLTPTPPHPDTPAR